MDIRLRHGFTGSISPKLGIAFLICTVPRHGVGQPRVRRTPDVSATQSPCGRRGSMSQPNVPRQRVLTHSKSPKLPMQFARTRCMVTIPKVSPFHCRKPCGVALSRIAYTQGTQPAAAGPAQGVLRWLSDTRWERQYTPLVIKPRMKSSRFSRPGRTARGATAQPYEARADLRLQNCSRLGFLWEITAPKMASHMSTDRLRAGAGPHPIGSDQIRSGCFVVVCILLQPTLTTLLCRDQVGDGTVLLPRRAASTGR